MNAVEGHQGDARKELSGSKLELYKFLDDFDSNPPCFDLSIHKQIEYIVLYDSSLEC